MAKKQTARPSPARAPVEPVPSPRRHRILPAIGLALVFLLKLIVLWQLKDHPLLQPDAGLDTTAYANLARRVIAGDYGLGPGLYYVSPFYIYFLALCYGVTKSFTAVRVIQIALGTLTVACIFVMTREWYGRRAAWIASAAAALCGVLTFYEVLLLQSAVDGVLTAGGLCALTLALRGRELKLATLTVTPPAWFLAAGTIFAVQTLNRPNVLLPAVGFVLLLTAMRRVKPALWVVAGLALGLAPVAVRNLAVAHEWSLVSSHGGLNFYIGNHANATGLYEFVPGVRPGIEGQRDDTRRVAETAVGHSLSDAEVSDYFFSLGRTWMLDHPIAALALDARKLFYVFHADHIPLPFSYAFYADDAGTLLRGLVVNPWLIVPLGLVGLTLVAPRGERAAFVIWVSFVPAYAVGVAVFFVAERYRLPLFIPMCVGTGALIDRSIAVATSRESSSTRWLVIAAGATPVLLGLVQWPIGLTDSREGDRTRMAMLAIEGGRYDEGERWAALAIKDSTTLASVEATIGRGLIAAGQSPRALPYLQQAKAHSAFDPQVGLDLAAALKGTGDPAGALSMLSSVQFAADADPSLELAAGRLAATLGANDLALAHFRAVVGRHPEMADAWAQLGFSLLTTNQLGDAAHALGEAVRLNPKDATAFGGLAVCELRLNQRDEAIAHARTALALDPGEALARQVMSALKAGG